ncbi:MAG: hypothetical protein KAV00_06240, partial [Phycisphaerae bacterium]|nr:hypothetical protein [Phycisphaerae bacterium]
MNNELIKTLQDQAEVLLSALDRLLENSIRLTEQIERVEAEREQLFHAVQSDQFACRVSYFRSVAELVRELGAEGAIAYRRGLSCEDGTTPEEIEGFEMLVRAISRGMTVGEYVECSDL